MRVTQVQTSFSAGEIDPALDAQRDLKVYAAGVKRGRNCLWRSTGALAGRPGTLDLAGLNGECRLADFEFSNEQRYVMAFRSAAVDIYSLDGALLKTLAGPWSSTQVYELTMTQRGDTMIITHQGFWPKVIKRTGAAAFTIADFVFEVSIDSRKVYQPYYKFTDAAVTLKPSGNTGAITLTASTAIFNNSYIGQRIRIYDAEVLITGYTSGTVVSGTVQGKLEGKLDLDPFKTTAGSLVVEVTHLFHGLATGQSITLSGGTSTGRVPADKFTGTFVVTVLDDNRYEITLPAMTYTVREDLNQDGTDESNVYNAAHDTEDGGGSNVKFNVAGAFTRNWSEPAISKVRGYPGSCCFHEGRLFFASTPSQPDGVWGSNALLPFRFDVGKGYDGDSVQLAAGSEDSSRILHLVSNGDLQIFTATREAIFVTQAGEAITPTNMRIKGQSNAGVGNLVPLAIDNVSLFVQESGQSVSEFGFSTEGGGYSANQVSVLAAHLIRTPVAVAVTQGAQGGAEQYAFFVNADGTVAVYHSRRQEGLKGFLLWEFETASILSVCAIGTYVFFCAYVRGDYRLYRVATDAIEVLDGAVHHVSATGAKTAWTLDARVRGRVVDLYSDVGYLGQVDVPANGAITTNVACSDLVAGDAFDIEIESLPPSIEVASGRRDGTKIRLVRSITNFLETENAAIGDQPVAPLLGEADVAQVSAVTGQVERRHLGYRRDPTLTIGQAAPGRFCLRGQTREYSI